MLVPIEQTPEAKRRKEPRRLHDLAHLPALPRKERGFSVYVSNILKHSLEILGLPISGFSRYVAKLCSLPHIQGYRIF